MNVGQVYWPRVVWISSNQPLSTAARRMREFDVGSVLVFDQGTLVGIVTEHDLLRANAEAVSPKDVIVRDYMTADPMPIGIDEGVTDAASVMLALHARHLPVVDGDRIVGVVSARDLLAVLAEGSLPGLARRRRSTRLVSDLRGLVGAEEA